MYLQMLSCSSRGNQRREDEIKLSNIFKLIPLSISRKIHTFVEVFLQGNCQRYTNEQQWDGRYFRVAQINLRCYQF